MHESGPAIRRLADGAASITWDDRHAPVLVATWAGAPTTAMIEQAQAWLDQVYAQARAAGSSGLVIISDATQGQLPGVDARRRLLELHHDPELMLKVIAVVPIRNALMHGVLSALSWVLDRRFAIATSFEQALDLAEQVFSQRGLAVPDSLERLRMERRM